MDEDLLEEVHDLLTAKAVWDCLQTRFVELTRSRAVDIKILLSRVKLTSQGTDKYLRDLKVMANELREIRKPLSDEDLVTYAPTGLPKEYEYFVTTNANDRNPLTFERLHIKLMHQEKRLKQFYLEPNSAVEVEVVVVAVIDVTTISGAKTTVTGATITRQITRLVVAMPVDKVPIVEEVSLSLLWAELLPSSLQVR
ncbi:hypothetical protein CRG98_009371 [Punica granatum]|uniref:Uncharacterized protein n=1 Tax=Punica granatum TaxID=22663 RepID=A0A2I0KP75_PUNGR|nr:hypothetical protein CRG98_009371 [Punica granatum]